MNDTSFLTASHSRVVFFQKFTPDVMREMLSDVSEPKTLVLSYDVWNYVICDPDWQPLYEPPFSASAAKTGSMGKLLGLEIITDALLYSEHRLIPAGNAYVVGENVVRAAYAKDGLA